MSFGINRITKGDSTYTCKLDNWSTEVRQINRGWLTVKCTSDSLESEAGRVKSDNQTVPQLTKTSQNIDKLHFPNYKTTRQLQRL